MSNLGYYSRCGSTRRGFRVHPSKRLSVKTFRARFVCLVRLLNRSYRALRRGFCRENRPASVLTTSKRDRRFSSSSSSSTRKPLVIKEMNCMTRSNSFYSEAIKECLEFIKRNSVSTADQQSRSSGGPEGEEEEDWVREISSNSILLSKIV